MITQLKKLLVRTPIHKPIVDLRSLWISKNWSEENTEILDNKTVYCISPYKTGTTFLASSFGPPVSEHEPLHHTSLHTLNRDFRGYFIRRLNSLNLKLECSGYLSAYVDQLAQTDLSKELTFICVLRKPSSWVTSVVNHYQLVKGNGHYYLWDNELFWKRHVGVNLANFLQYDESEKLKAVDKLIAFYMSFTKKTRKLKNVHYVWLNDLNNFLPTIGQLIGEEANLEKAEKNNAKVRKYVYKNDKLDAAYERMVNKLIA